MTEYLVHTEESTEVLLDGNHRVFNLLKRKLSTTPEQERSSPRTSFPP